MVKIAINNLFTTNTKESIIKVENHKGEKT